MATEVHMYMYMKKGKNDVEIWLGFEPMSVEC